MTMPTVSKAVLKARLLAYLRDVEATGEPVIVTSYGTPVARITRITRITQGATVNDQFADARGALHFTGSLDDPTDEEWNHGGSDA